MAHPALLSVGFSRQEHWSGLPFETRYQLPEKTVRNTNTWRLNFMFLKKQQVTEEIEREIKEILETNDSENTTQNLWDAVKAVLRGKFIAIQSYSRNKKNIE